MNGANDKTCGLCCIKGVLVASSLGICLDMSRRLTLCQVLPNVSLIFVASMYRQQSKAVDVVHEMQAR